MKEPFISIIICTRDRSECLDKLSLNSVSELNYSNFEVVVVDDASKDNTRQIVENYRKKIKNLKYERNKKNKGACGSRNFAVKNSSGEIIAFIDDDCAVDKNWAKELVMPYLEDEKLMLSGGKIYVKDTAEIQNSKGEIWTGNISFRKDIFKKFLFDEFIYFDGSYAYDEGDLIDRIECHGYPKALYNEKAVVRHFRSSAPWKKDSKIGKKLDFIYSISKNYSSGLKDYYKMILATILLGKRAKQLLGVKENKISQSIDEIDSFRGMLSIKRANLWIKIPYTLFALFLEIPIKASIKHRAEERLFRNG